MITLRSYDFRLTPLDGDLLVRPLTSQGHFWASDNLRRGERLVGSQYLVLAENVDKTLIAILRAGFTIAPLLGE
jgi:hypothetical protein